VKYRDFYGMVLNTLKADKDGTYSDELIYEAVCNATDAILPWVPKASLTTFVADGILDRFSLPADCYNVEAVQDADLGNFVEKDNIAAGKIRNSTSTNTSVKSFSWIEYPRGQIYLSRVIEADRNIRVYYTAYFNKPESKDDFDFVLETPRFAVAGMIFWASAYCVLPFATGSAQVRQWNQRIDSGTPTDNALEQNARFYRQLFVDEMSRVPRMTGALK